MCNHLLFEHMYVWGWGKMTFRCHMVSSLTTFVCKNVVMEFLEEATKDLVAIRNQATMSYSQLAVSKSRLNEAHQNS